MHTVFVIANPVLAQALVVQASFSKKMVKFITIRALIRCVSVTDVPNMRSVVRMSVITTTNIRRACDTSQMETRVAIVALV